MNDTTFVSHRLYHDDLLNIKSPNSLLRSYSPTHHLTDKTTDDQFTNSLSFTDGEYKSPYRQMHIERVQDSIQDDNLQLSNDIGMLPSGLGSAPTQDHNTCCENQLPSQSVFNHYRLQYDPQPLVIYKASKNPPAIYKQNVIIRYFKPPSLPPPGPIIIREIRPPPVQPAPPLIIRQRMPKPETPPPLVLREKPPPPPKDIPPQVILKRLPPLPPPPRQVIIERYPPLPPKPRDIIIERWMPYEINRKRKVIYQLAPEETNPPPKNIIITYQSKKPSVKTIVNKLGVMQMEPNAYIAKHGNTLLDTSILLEKARKAGILSNLNLDDYNVDQLENNQQQITDGSLWIDPEEVYGFSNVSLTNLQECSISNSEQMTLQFLPKDDNFNFSLEQGEPHDFGQLVNSTETALDSPYIMMSPNNDDKCTRFTCPINSQQESMEKELSIEFPSREIQNCSLLFNQKMESDVCCEIEDDSINKFNWRHQY